MTITLNGKPADIPDESTLLTLLAAHNLTQDKVAVELNRRLARGDAYTRPLQPGDEVEIVTFVGGG